MVDTGDGDGIDGQQGYDAAADVREHPKGLDVGDPGLDHVPGQQGVYVVLPAALLGGPAGEQGGKPPRPVPEHILYQEAHRPVHPGEDGDVPHRALPDADGTLLPGDQAPHGAQVHHQVVGAVAQQGPGLQNAPGPHGLGQGGGGAEGGAVFRGVDQTAFRVKSHFGILLFLQSSI